MDRSSSSNSVQSHFEDPTIESFYSKQSKVLQECFDALVAQKGRLDVYEPLSSDTNFRKLDQTTYALQLESLIDVVEELQSTISDNVALEGVLVQIITKIQKLKKENAILRKSLEKAQLPLRPPWSGFREKRTDVSSDEACETEASLDENGSQLSTSRSCHAPPSFDGRPLDGFIGDLERCRIDSQCGSQSSKEQSRRTSVATSIRSESTPEQYCMTESHLANLYANQMDLIFETDRQRRGANPDPKTSVIAWVDDVVLETTPPDDVPLGDVPMTPGRGDGESRPLLTFPEHQDHKMPTQLTSKPSVWPALPAQYPGSLGIGGIFCVGLGTLVLSFFIAYVYTCVKARQVEGFFDRNSRELDYYKRVYGW